MVTTSTTEAELLALSQASKEGIYIERLLKELTVDVNEVGVTIQCDNMQTIRLVNDEISRLQTQLWHVNIHNHWLRQEAQNGKIRVIYIPKKSMTANRLTKSLLRAEFSMFYAQLGIENLEQDFRKRRVNEMDDLKDLCTEDLVVKCAEEPAGTWIDLNGIKIPNRKSGSGQL